MMYIYKLSDKITENNYYFVVKNSGDAQRSILNFIFRMAENNRAVRPEDLQISLIGEIQEENINQHGIFYEVKDTMVVAASQWVEVWNKKAADNLNGLGGI